jgi:hypothetical protein
MAHVLKDSMNHYAIEVSRGPKHVSCIVRINGEVEFKKYPLTKMITDHEYQTNSGEYLFDQRWERVLRGDPLAPDPKHEQLTAELKDLHHVIGSFLSEMLPMTDKARRLLERLRDDPMATSAPQATNEEDTQMATKTKKVKKAKKEGVPRKAKFSPEAKITLLAEKNFHEGSVRSKCFAVIQKHKELTVAEYLKHCSGRQINKAQALSCLAKLAETEQKVTTVKVS